MVGGTCFGLVPSDTGGRGEQVASTLCPSCHAPAGREGSRDFGIETYRLHGREKTGGHRNDPGFFSQSWKMVCLSVGCCNKIQTVPTYGD